MKKTCQQWKLQSKNKDKFIVFYKQLVLDMAAFIKIHPGGTKVLLAYKNKDITDILFTIYPHPKTSTLNALNRYIIGYNTSSSYYMKQASPSKTQIKNKTPTKGNKKVNFKINEENKVINNSLGMANAVNTKSDQANIKNRTRKLSSIKIIDQQIVGQQKQKTTQVAVDKKVEQLQREVFSTQDDIDLQLESQQNKQNINIPCINLINFDFKNIYFQKKQNNI